MLSWWQLILIPLVTFIGLVIVLRLVFYKDLGSALRRLKNLHEEGLVKETQFNEELQRIKQEGAVEVERSRYEADRIVEEARKEANILRAKLEEEAKKESKKIVSQGHEELEKLRKDVMVNIKTRALDFSLQIIDSVFSEKGKESLQRQLTDEIIEEIDKVEKERFPLKTDKTEVISSYPLSEQEKSRLQQILLSKINHEVVLIEKVTPELISGLIIKMDKFVIDGSLKNKLAKVIEYLKK
ncbi:MAG: F0F1 ATP synthase subunit delta [Candidatus Omnitrophota bacterium]